MSTESGLFAWPVEVMLGKAQEMIPTATATATALPGGTVLEPKLLRDFSVRCPLILFTRVGRLWRSDLAPAELV